MAVSTKNKKQLKVFQSSSLREFVQTVNEYEIQKEDVLATFQNGHSHEYVLLYYK